MHASNFSEYTRRILDIIEELLSNGQAVLLDFTNDQRSTLRGFIGGVLHIEDGSQLHFREFVDVTLAEPRLMYAYHYQDAESSLIFRYDNAAHRPPLPQAEHRHSQIGAFISHAPTFADVIDEILG
jgi:hypothetical protein